MLNFLENISKIHLFNRQSNKKSKLTYSDCFATWPPDLLRNFIDVIWGFCASNQEHDGGFLCVVTYSISTSLPGPFAVFFIIFGRGLCLLFIPELALGKLNNNVVVDRVVESFKY